MNYRKSGQAGFTLLEVLIVVVITGILGVIATPSWLNFLANREVEAARDELHQGIRQAQTQAIANGAAWQFSIRESSDQVEWAVHQSGISWDAISTWQQLSPKIVLDLDNTSNAIRDGVHYIAFDFKGTVEQRYIITLEDRNSIADKKCVWIANLLGRIQNGKELPAPNRWGLKCF
ncbi:MAG: Tfp pilus assembly protein FimT/FimU [Leptolyngbyaceae cyanobacterium]